MPPKIRELIAELERNGFTNRGGKESHRNYEHILGIRVTISGKLGDDARKYQEQLVKDVLRKVKAK
ncbi:MAG TPA: type II toxin-antitoxin system HicA family toxin [Pyrinomonadaceae bacterium]|jgi:predicted RNA binding protein YcfA (HicA-like mRNA interferase family)